MWAPVFIDDRRATLTFGDNTLPISPGSKSLCRFDGLYTGECSTNAPRSVGYGIPHVLRIVVRIAQFDIATWVLSFEFQCADTIGSKSAMIAN